VGHLAEVLEEPGDRPDDSGVRRDRLDDHRGDPAGMLGEGQGDRGRVVERQDNRRRRDRGGNARAARDGLGLTAIRSTAASLDDIYRAALQEAGLHRAALEAPEPEGAVA